jgi:hypothetical protein
MPELSDFQGFRQGTRRSAVRWLRDSPDPFLNGADHGASGLEGAWLVRRHGQKAGGDNSVTNSLIGPVSNAVSQAKKLGTSPAGKQKQQNGSGGATSSSDHGPTAASKVSPAKSP